MKGRTIVSRQPDGFEVAHRMEQGEHRVEISIGHSFNELYWDAAARDLVSNPDRYSDLLSIMIQQQAGWLLDVLPVMAERPQEVTTDSLVALAAG